MSELCPVVSLVVLCDFPIVGLAASELAPPVLLVTQVVVLELSPPLLNLR